MKALLCILLSALLVLAAADRRWDEHRQEQRRRHWNENDREWDHRESHWERDHDRDWERDRRGGERDRNWRDAEVVRGEDGWANGPLSGAEFRGLTDAKAIRQLEASMNGAQLGLVGKKTVNLAAAQLDRADLADAQKVLFGAGPAVGANLPGATDSTFYTNYEFPNGQVLTYAFTDLNGGAQPIVPATTTLKLLKPGRIVHEGDRGWTWYRGSNGMCYGAQGKYTPEQFKSNAVRIDTVGTPVDAVNAAAAGGYYAAAAQGAGSNNMQPVESFATTNRFSECIKVLNPNDCNKYDPFTYYFPVKQGNIILHYICLLPYTEFTLDFTCASQGMAAAGVNPQATDLGVPATSSGGVGSSRTRPKNTVTIPEIALLQVGNTEIPFTTVGDNTELTLPPLNVVQQLTPGKAIVDDTGKMTWYESVNGNFYGAKGRQSADFFTKPNNEQNMLLKGCPTCLNPCFLDPSSSRCHTCVAYSCT